MANSSISVTEGSGKNIATHSISESTTKEIQRIEINNSSGMELGTSSNPIQVSLANTASNTTAVKVDNSAVTQPVRISIAATPVKGTTSAITDTTSTQVIAANATKATYITDILVTNSHATVGTFVAILDGSTIVWEGYAAAVGGGFSHSFTTPLVCTSNTAVNAQPVTTGSNVIVSISGYQI